MITRDQWAEIYDWARYNGLSPLDFIGQAQKHKIVPTFVVNGMTKDEQGMYEACRQFSISRTKYPTSQEKHAV